MGEYTFNVFAATVFSYNKTTFTINDRPLYDFNVKTGELKISTNKKSLDDILYTIGKFPEFGLNIVLPTPISAKPQMEFNCVRLIKQIDEFSQYLMEYKKLPKIKFSYDHDSILKDFNEKSRHN
jgi:hypothetical protein